MYVTSTGQMCSANIGAPDWNKFPGVYVTDVNLAEYSCDVLGIAVHEVGHALGMLHEQSRTDYSKYVKINWDNIEENGKSQYDTNTDADRTVPYDLQSVMHYPGTMFGKYNDYGKQLTVMTKTNNALNKGKVMATAWVSLARMLSNLEKCTVASPRSRDSSCARAMVAAAAIPSASATRTPRNDPSWSSKSIRKKTAFVASRGAQIPLAASSTGPQIVADAPQVAP